MIDNCYVKANESPSPKDIEDIKLELDRKDVLFPKKIAAKSFGGEILSVQMPSFSENKPFPTLFWLVSKKLVKKISYYEMKGWIIKIQNIINNDEILLEKYIQDHKKYIKLRYEMMSDQEKGILKEHNFEEKFNKYGIGGISNFKTVRCLHVHYAYHLGVGESLVGKIMDDELKINEFLRTI